MLTDSPRSAGMMNSSFHVTCLSPSSRSLCKADDAISFLPSRSQLPLLDPSLATRRIAVSPCSRLIFGPDISMSIFAANVHWLGLLPVPMAGSRQPYAQCTCVLAAQVGRRGLRAQLLAEGVTFPSYRTSPGQHLALQDRAFLMRVLNGATTLFYPASIRS